eukprot:TRINITY_DN8566_c0_g1_i1.p1 TRINITY_DN8566_c0_g1~~TRINITY_DN8566_c0_g1_i1.p1  ORF type:complete len:428 (+),score=97.05 TRINITY_DN8566_c0_g1_i1:41-1285(+)
MDSDSDEAPELIETQAELEVTGPAGARTGMTRFDVEQACAELVAKGGGIPGIDWKVPVSIVTGFLGSGKSTLVQHILTVQTEAKIAVMVNEFGDSNDIERAMRVSDQGNEDDDWIEMSNGCMCCKFKDQAVEALENLVKRKGRFDHIVIETSGLADPSPLISMFWQDPELESPLILNGVITVVDAQKILSYVSQSGEGGFVEATQQIALAGTLILNKTDLVDEEELDKVTAMLGRINPDTPIVRTSFSKIENVSKLLQVGDRVLSPEEEHSTAVEGPSHQCGDTCTHDHKPHGGNTKGSQESHHHTPSVGSVTLSAPDDELTLPNESTVDEIMKLMLWDTISSNVTILRLKAVFKIANSPNPIAVQGVGELFDKTKLQQPFPGGTRIVAIGRNVESIDWMTKIKEVIAAASAGK